MNKLAAARHKAEEKRAAAEANRNNQAAKTEEQAEYIRSCTFFIFFISLLHLVLLKRVTPCFLLMYCFSIGVLCSLPFAAYVQACSICFLYFLHGLK
jgi:hypothetical protein